MKLIRESIELIGFFFFHKSIRYLYHYNWDLDLNCKSISADMSPNELKVLHNILKDTLVYSEIMH